jgi:hypothetical protein
MVRYGKSPDRIASAGLSFREKKEFHKSPRLPRSNISNDG